MPIYEYRCKRCGVEIEAIQKFSDKPLRKCRECSGPLEKLISQSSFQLKGSGWYVTDYARKSKGSGDSSSSGTSGKAAPAKSADGKGASGGGANGSSGSSESPGSSTRASGGGPGSKGKGS